MNKAPFVLREVTDPEEIVAVRKLAPKQDFGPFAPPHGIKLTWKGHTFRAIWSRLEIRPEHEHFHEFLVDLLKRTLSVKWIKDQLALSPEQQHVAVRWLVEWSDLSKRSIPVDHKPGELFSASPTGGAKACLMLARDLYYLQLVHEIPKGLTERLRDTGRFQGVRYEIAIAAAFLLANFEIEWVEENTKKHCEFIATHRVTKESIGVETKSRHRAGSYNYPGTFDENAAIADVSRTFKDALDQKPGDRPFAVFVDMNLPPDEDPRQSFDRWGKRADEIASAYGRRDDTRSEFSVAAFTNFGWHYLHSETVSPAGSFCYRYRPPYAEFPIQNTMTLQAIETGLWRYPNTPEDHDDAPRYP